MSELHDLLERVTDRVETPRLGPRALVLARRRRVRRRGAVAAVGTAAVIAALLLVPRGDAPDVRPARPVVVNGTAPAIDPDVVQDVWDPRDVTTRPTQGLVPDGALLLDDRVGPYRIWGGAQVPRPDGLGPGATSALSRDGEQIAALGVSGLWVRAVDGGTWRRYDVPRRVGAEGVDLTWVDDATLLLGSWKGGWRLDLTTGEATELAGLGSYPDLAVDPAGGYAAVVGPAPGLRFDQWHPDGERWSSVATGPLDSLQRPVLSDSAVAVTKGDFLAETERAVTDRDGLLVLDRDGLATRAFLPVEDTDTWYSDNGGLTALAWLDDDTVLVSVLPEPEPPADTPATRYLVTWSVDAGELTVVGTVPAASDLSVAPDVIRR